MVNRDINSPQTGAVLRSYGYYASVSDNNLIASVEKKAFKHLHGVQSHTAPGKSLYYRPRRNRLAALRSLPPVYQALLPHLTFTGSNLEPVWVNKSGQAVIAWHNADGEKTLLVGLDIVEEIIRHRQGDLTKAQEGRTHFDWGYAGERPLHLFEDQIIPKYRTHPWADYLGFFLAEALSSLSGFPLLEPLPNGAKGALILTGDDDQAYLEKYEAQLHTIGDLPITYFLHYLTRHTQETIRRLPHNVQFGLHPDALDQPDEYDNLCAAQADKIKNLTGSAPRLVRNHGFLSRGYLGHLNAWDDCGLKLDVNYPGVDGTALNGSFLPMRVRRPDGSWSEHFSLLTAFGDGMIYALNLSQRKANARIKRVARQIESNYPGVLVFNYHPQNIGSTRELHKEVLALAARPGWIALGLENYLEWLEMLEVLNIELLGADRVRLMSPGMVDGLVIRYPTARGWRKRNLESWAGQMEIILQ
jgi:hypothetical protein